MFMGSGGGGGVGGYTDCVQKPSFKFNNNDNNNNNNNISIYLQSVQAQGTSPNSGFPQKKENRIS